MAVSVKDVFGEAARSIEDVRKRLHVARPCTVHSLVTQYHQPITVSWDDVKNDPLTGSFTITLHSNGAWEFSGRMYNTGKDVYDFALEVVVTIPGRATASGQEPDLVIGFGQRGHLAGSIFGSGSRTKTWSLSGPADALKLKWLEARHPKVEAKLERDNHTWGTTLSTALFLGKVGLAHAVAGPVGSLFIVAAEAEDTVGPALGGIPGASLVSKGIIALRGLGGTVLATLLDLTDWEPRPLESYERNFAQEVFGDTLPWGRIRLTSASSLDDRAFVMPLFDDIILVNMQNTIAYESPMDYARDGEKNGQLFIHELVHAWQVAHTAFPTGWVCKGLTVQATTIGGDMGTYRYGPPVGPWSAFNLEQQGSIVEGWFAGNQTSLDVHARQRIYQPMDPKNPYFDYIKNNIRAAKPH